MFNRSLVSPRPQDFKPRVDLGTRIVKPYADTAVNMGKLMVASGASTPLSVGSYLARQMGANKLAGNLAQGAINVRGGMGYGTGSEAFDKGVRTTADALVKTAIVGNIPNMARSGMKMIASKPARMITKEAPKQIPRITNALKNFVTNNERNFFLKGRTPTYELNMPTRVFQR